MNFKNNTDNLDQHFLVSETVINKFIEASNLTKNDICLEIGPGKGILTKIIAPKVKKTYSNWKRRTFRRILKRNTKYKHHYWRCHQRTMA